VPECHPGNRAAPDYALWVARIDLPQALAVPFVDLAPQHASLRAELLAEIGELIDSGAFTNGPQVRGFESSFAAYCGTAECVGVGSGLDALRLALVASGVGEGDEVVVPATTFIATLESVSQTGATPVVADVSPATYTLDPVAAQAAMTARTRFLLPVHLYGQMADMARLCDLADGAGIDVLEDACQAHGATRDGIRAGAGGRAAAFSFYPGKNLGAFGDGGAVTTDDAAIAERVRALREHGQVEKYRHEVAGYTSRLDSIQALVILRKLEHLDRWTAERRQAAAYLQHALDGVGDLVLPAVPPGSDPVWHLYVVQTADPVALAEHLAARGIGSGRHYPEPVHLTNAYRHLDYVEGAFPVAEALARQALSLPLFPGITEAQLGSVASAVSDYFVRGG
jgi:dTDP-4-amino-4,6-dideoxygalactose transaminase